MYRKSMLIAALFSIFIMSACSQTSGKTNESANSTQTTEKKEPTKVQEESVKQKTNPATVEVAN